MGPHLDRKHRRHPVFSPIFPLPAGTTCTYFNVIDCIPDAVLHVPTTVLQPALYLIPSLFSPSPNPSHLVTNSPSVLCIYELVSDLFVLFFRCYTSEIIWYLSFCDIFHLANGKVSFFMVE